MEEKVEISMEDSTFLERKNNHNYRNGFKFQYLPLNFPLNILVKITGTGHSFKVNITKI